MNIDKYIDKLNLTIKSKTSSYYNIKCPICGDSHTNKYKARGYINIDGNNFGYYCHNECGGMTFQKFLEQVDMNVAREYKRDSLQEYIKSKSKSINADILKIPKEEIKDIYEVNTKVFDRMYYKSVINEKEYNQEVDIMELNEQALVYLLNRGFTREDVKDFKFCETSNDIVIPYFYDKTKNLVYGVQTRSILEKRFHLNFFGNNKITNLFEVLRLPKGSEIYCFEGEFDRLSSGINNSIALLGTSLSIDLKEILKDYKLIFCTDADNSGDKSALKYTKLGYNVLVHNNDMYYFKDFNKLLELGQTKENIKEYIMENIRTPRVAEVMLMRRV